jgi:hypothetical protein
MAAIQTYSQGDDITFNVKMRKTDGPPPTYWDIENDVYDLAVWAYTDGANIAKASKIVRPDYFQMIKVTTEEYKVWLTGDITKNFTPGRLMVEMIPIWTEAELPDGKENRSKATKFPIIIEGNESKGLS